jgi:hypothetical protein
LVEADANRSVSPVSPVPSTATSPDALLLDLVLRRDPGGAAIAVEAICRRDLADAMAEIWFEAHLRRGSPATQLGGVTAQLRPVYRDDADSGRFCAGFTLETPGAAGAPVARFFPREFFEPAAARRARTLVEDGTLETGDLYYYSLAPAAAAADGVSLCGPEGRGAPSQLPLALRPLLERAGVERHRAEEPYPVFFTSAARERAERISRKGADAQPPVETGGLLVGPLCTCPETGEIFSVVVDVLEATDSDATTYTLNYSGTTWARIQTILRARQAQPATRHHRILGQCHGHNFLPLAGVPPCEMCHRVEVCTRNSAYLSPEDRTWCRATFSCEPWQLSQVFGLDARSRPVETFYGQRGGSLERRRYHVVDRVDDLIEGS